MMKSMMNTTGSRACSDGYSACARQLVAEEWGFDEDGPDSWGEHPIPRTQPAGYLFPATSKTNINPEITYEYEYGITAGG
jgi:hypothetical protein